MGRKIMETVKPEGYLKRRMMAEVRTGKAQVPREGHAATQGFPPRLPLSYLFSSLQSETLVMLVPNESDISGFTLLPGCRL